MLWIHVHLKLVEGRAKTAPLGGKGDFVGCYRNCSEGYLEPVVQTSVPALAKLPDRDRVKGIHSVADALNSDK